MQRGVVKIRSDSRWSRWGALGKLIPAVLVVGSFRREEVCPPAVLVSHHQQVT